MNDVDLSRLAKLYVNAKNKNREYVEPIDENIVQRALKIITQKLENASGQFYRIRVPFDGMVVSDSELTKVSNILNEQKIRHNVHKNFFRSWIEISL